MLNPLGLLYVFTSCFEPKSWDWHWQWQSFYHKNFVWRNKFSCGLQKQMYIPQTLEEQCQMIQRAKTGCSSGQHHIELRLCIVNLESIWTPCTSKMEEICRVSNSITRTCSTSERTTASSQDSSVHFTEDSDDHLYALVFWRQ